MTGSFSPLPGAASYPALEMSELIRAVPAILLVFDRNGALVDLSDEAVRFLGTPRERLLGSTTASLFESAEPLKSAAGRCELCLGGGHGPVTATVGHRRDDNAMLVVLVPNDRTRAERQHIALHSTNLATIGELATGVAHEINNPINGIINYGQLLYDRLADGDPAGADLAGRIMREGRRISKIVRNLLGLARHDAESRVATTLTGELEAVLSLTRAQLRRENITLTVEIDPDPPPVLVNPYQVQQVLHNVIQNARYALNQRFPEGGADKRLQITLHAERDQTGNFLRITVADCGVGIPAAIMARVTEPFFTTKPVGAGTGLGLSICREILNDHGGRLLIESEAGSFTRVHIDLPASGES